MPKKAYVIGMMQGFPSSVASFPSSFLPACLPAPECLCTISMCGVAAVGS